MYRKHYNKSTSQIRLVVTEEGCDDCCESSPSSPSSLLLTEIPRGEIEKRIIRQGATRKGNDDYTTSASADERERSGRGESIISTTAREVITSDPPPRFLHEPTVENLDRVNLANSAKSLDPYIAIQEEISFPRDSSFSLYRLPPTLRRRKRSVDLHQLARTTTTGTGTGAVVVARAIGSVDGEQEACSRRSSNFSIPYFYHPDPYSIVVSRYLDELGSISSSYSTASGSETTEYLELSEASLLSSPEERERAESNEKLERRLTSSSRLLTISESTTAGDLQEDKMNFASALSTSEEYQSFRSSVPLKRICVEADGSKEWKVYDAGPRSIRTPLMCLGPACASSDVFYRQILNLTARGIRVLSVESPVYWSVEDWCKGLKKLLDSLNLDKVHLFGASLGGFLAQKFAEYTYNYSRVASLILCNTFLDTSIFNYHDSAMIFWMLPSVILKKLIIENITNARIMDLDIAHAIEFMIERLNNLSQQELASRMTLNCVNSHVDTFKLKPIKMTIMDVFDESALSSQARDDIYTHYTEAKLAHLKSGGNFPYLSRSDEVNMHIMVHLRSFNGTKYSAQLEETLGSVPIPVVIGSANKATTVASSKTQGSAINISTNPQDILGHTDPPIPPSSFQDANQEFKEKAASVLGLPVS